MAICLSGCSGTKTSPGSDPYTPASSDELRFDECSEV